VALSKGPQRVSIDPMEVADLDAVIEIERLSSRSPWSRQVFLEELARDFAYVELVRDAASGEVVAFGNYWHVADELHILSIATHPRARRAGHATRMLAHMIDFARREICRCLTLEVRRSNIAAQRLYRRFAFQTIGVRPHYYAEDQEDAIVMLLELG
jgi:ribosomal-protein-alanine N-acetyltransferase